VGSTLVDDFHPFRLMRVIEKAELLADEPGGGFVEATVNGDGPVLGHPSSNLFAKVILEVGRWCPDEFDVIGESVERRLAGAGMGPLMILLPDPQVQGLVQLIQSFPLEAGEKL